MNDHVFADALLALSTYTERFGHVVAAASGRVVRIEFEYGRYLDAVPFPAATETPAVGAVGADARSVWLDAGSCLWRVDLYRRPRWRRAPRLLASATDRWVIDAYDRAVGDVADWSRPPHARHVQTHLRLVPKPVRSRRGTPETPFEV
ncbi:hypothetical protein [Rhodococcus sp. HNM0569]|uniref:hypothetical protein n=1 Tax=Rhodococcus sp. HNM0569 TaxID=2716340 RepID=UPI00146EA5FB|nr:hypothetical protein [Rhodococcus sp. HNM0569]NLU82551.1 hypothetical protein [Rhodococcus sp. HNM0569]